MIKLPLSATRLAIGVAVGLALGASAQADEAGKVPRTGDGHPNFQGQGTNTTRGPPARPRGAGGRELPPPAEAGRRLPTAPVEVRGAGEGMSVLGELGPNESTYAVLSAPVPARIVRMIAGAGEPVAAGEPLAELQVDLQHGADVPLKMLGQFWVARDDARNFMILGDPAVRLRVKDMPELA